MSWKPKDGYELVGYLLGLAIFVFAIWFASQVLP